MIYFIDFTFWLFIAFLIVGMIQLLIKGKLLPISNSYISKIYEFNKSIVWILLLVVLLRGSMFEPFKIPSASMMPTLIKNDFILVNKLSYSVQLPIFNYPLIKHSKIKHGDVVVFYFPVDPTKHYIKRVVGLPGDTVRYVDKQLIVNSTQYIKEYVKITAQQISGVDTIEYIERLPSREYKIYNIEHARNSCDEGEWIVPNGKYFVMGDNRDNSYDSRCWGLVPERNVVGEAIVIWMHFGKEVLSRIGVIN
ncbi:MAG: signal peptidase I [Methylacidiphilales bacterium]|nr:signal peptidase I [Candidatus Methylacidiphilales bacterium]